MKYGAEAVEAAAQAYPALTLYVTGHGGKVAGDYFLGRAAIRGGTAFAIGAAASYVVLDGAIAIGTFAAAARDMRFCNP